MPSNQANLAAEQIRQQMNYVRQDLDDDVEQVVEDANSLGDVRAYVKAQPIGWMVAAAVAGFAAVPSKQEKVATARTPNPFVSGNGEAQPVKKGSIFGAALGMAATMGTRLLVNKLATAGMGILEQSQAGRQPTASHLNAEPSNHEPYTG